MPFHRMSIIGVGLLGGSIGLAVRSALSDCEIIGYGHRDETLRRAREIGAIDRGTQDLREAVAGCDLIVLCTPVGRFDDILRDIAGHLRPGAIVTDVGSTKVSVVEAAARWLSDAVTFVGSHPIAGSEKRGVEFARADLFQNALCILTPTQHTPPAAAAAAAGFWHALGMRTCEMSPAEHDAALAEISHLPHALAAALVAMQSPRGMQLAGKGFLDTTRIAGGDGGLWRDIFLDNAGNMRTALARFRAMLDQFEAMLDPAQAENLQKWLDESANRRSALLAEKIREVTPD